MALASLRVCSAPGCRTLCRQSRCDKHSKRDRTNEQPRGSTTDRGYGWDWQKLRRRHIRANPLCEDCLERGRTTAATEVHHEEKISDAPERRLDETNLRSLCTPCHNARTARGE